MNGSFLEAMPIASLSFSCNGSHTHWWEHWWQVDQRGDIKPGGLLVLYYDPNRLRSCNEEWRLDESSGLHANVRFHPGGKIYRGQIARFGRAYQLVTPICCALVVPLDANLVEIWFESKFGESKIWDSRYGQNYWFFVIPQSPVCVKHSTIERVGAICSLKMINVFEATTKSDAFSKKDGRNHIQVTLSVKVWIKDIAYLKNVWIDVYVFDDQESLIQADTRPLNYSESSGEDGAFFMFNDQIYERPLSIDQHSIIPISVARVVRYRLYYVVNSLIFSDGILHEQYI